MKIFAFILFAAGLLVTLGAESREWFPLFATQIALGLMMMVVAAAFGLSDSEDM